MITNFVSQDRKEEKMFEPYKQHKEDRGNIKALKQRTLFPRQQQNPIKV